MGAVAGIPIIGCVISPAIKVRGVDDWILLKRLHDRSDGRLDIVSASPKTHCRGQIDLDTHSRMAIFLST